MATKLGRKVTFTLDSRLVEQLQRAVREGRAKSQTAFIEDALKTKLRKLEREEWVRSLEAASKDPMYLADIEEVEEDFKYADAEAARTIE